MKGIGRIDLAHLLALQKFSVVVLEDHFPFINKQAHLVGKRFALKIHQNTTSSYVVDGLVVKEPEDLVPALSSDEVL